MMKLSIIVPVYNVEKYLEKCLTSLVQQSLEDYEIIVVNDGSTDNSQLIIDQYAEKYPSLIQSFVKMNEGLSMTRNFGCKYAKGDYITFLDSDDYVELDLYDKMYNLAIQYNADVVVADIEYFWEHGENPSFIMRGAPISGEIVNQKEMFLAPLFSWNKIYKRSVFENLRCNYPAGLWYEDIPVTLKFFANSSIIAYCEYTGYHYQQRKSSILGSSYNPKMYDIFSIFSLVIEDFKNRGLFEQYKNELEYLLIEHYLLYGAFRFFKTQEYKSLMKKSFEEISTRFPNWKENKYIQKLPRKYQLFLRTNNTITMSLWKRILKGK